MQCVKIVLTGGPCAGKTTALSTIQGYFTKIGWKVVILDEAISPTRSSFSSFLLSSKSRKSRTTNII